MPPAPSGRTTRCRPSSVSGASRRSPLPSASVRVATTADTSSRQAAQCSTWASASRAADSPAARAAICASSRHVVLGTVSSYTQGVSTVPGESPLAQLLQVGRAAHPDIHATDAAIAAALGDRDVEPRPDAFVALAVLAGDAAAVRELDRLLRDVAPALRGIVRDHEIEELVQALRVRLVLPHNDKPPALVTYAGTGPLRAWLRVALVRSGLDRRRKPEGVPLDEAAWLALPADGGDPALAALRRTAGPQIRIAIEQAMARLSSRDRLLLRQHLLDGLAPPSLATLHGVHRVTAFRWIAEIRQRLLADVHASLATSLALDPSSLASLVRDLRDTVAPTLERILLVTPEPR
jgi:RNA polymerase sigma-70 factor (ECF subfamily)